MLMILQQVIGKHLETPFFSLCKRAAWPLAAWRFWRVFHVTHVEDFALCSEGIRSPWRGLIKEWQPTPVFLPGEPPWTEEPGGLQSMGSQSRTGWSKLHFHFLSWKDWLFRKITPATNVESRLEGEDGKQTAFLGGSWNKPGKQGWGPGGRLWNSGRRGGFQLPS